MAAGRGWRLLAAAVFVAGSAALFSLIGALGPHFTQVIHNNVRVCLVEDASTHVFDPASELIDKDSCSKLGHDIKLGLDSDKFPLNHVVFYAQLPFIEGAVMSRLFQYVIADMEIHYLNSDYPQRLVKYGLSQIRFSVALGYRDGVKGAWHRLASGNVSRTQQCRQRVQGFYACDHLPFFELGSCHHKQYLVNFFFPSLALSNALPEYEGTGALSQIHINVVLQTMNFTQLWLLLKSLLCPVSLLIAAWLLNRISLLPSPATLIEKSLAVLGVCLVTYNAPLELLSLFFNTPWMLVLNDFRQGLFVAALFSFWIIYVGEHRSDREGASHIGHYWKELGIVGMTSIFLFVYEFCERGIQVIYPFYSLWSNWLTRSIAWTFVGISGLSALLYAIILVVMVIQAYRNLQRKQYSIDQMSEGAQKKFQGIFLQWKFLLVLTILVAVISISTVILPSEVLLHQLQRGEEYSYYTALLTGNYGLWNSYVLLVMCLYAPPRKLQDSAVDEAAQATAEVTAAQRMLSKHSQE